MRDHTEDELAEVAGRQGEGEHGDQAEAIPAVAGERAPRTIDDLARLTEAVEQPGIEAPGLQPVESDRDAEIISVLANLTEAVERQGVEQQKILVGIYNRLGRNSTVPGKEPERTEKRKLGKLGLNQKDPKREIREITDNIDSEKVKKDQEISFRVRPTLSESAPKREIKAKEGVIGSEKGNEAPRGNPKTTRSDKANAPRQTTRTAAEVRESRTITLREVPTPPLFREAPPQIGESSSSVQGGTADAEPVAIQSHPGSTGTPGVDGGQVAGPAEAPPTPTRMNGFYLGDDGKVRRPDGKHANKIEARRFKRERGQDADEQRPGADGAPQTVLARAMELLDGKKLAGSDTADNAGVAMGSTFWLAAKEAKGMADEVKDAFADREINSTKDAKEYAKDKLVKAWGAIKSPLAWLRGSPSEAGVDGLAAGAAGTPGAAGTSATGPGTTAPGGDLVAMADAALPTTSNSPTPLIAGVGDIANPATAVPGAAGTPGAAGSAAAGSDAAAGSGAAGGLGAAGSGGEIRPPAVERAEPAPHQEPPSTDAAARNEATLKAAFEAVTQAAAGVADAPGKAEASTHTGRTAPPEAIEPSAQVAQSGTGERADAVSAVHTQSKPSSPPSSGAEAGSQTEFRQEAQEAQQAAAQQKLEAKTEERHDQVVERLDALIDASRPKSRGLVDMAADTLGEKLGRGRKGKGRRPGRSGRSNQLRSGDGAADGSRSRRGQGRTGRMPSIGEGARGGAGGGGGRGAPGGRGTSAVGGRGVDGVGASGVRTTGTPGAAVRGQVTGARSATEAVKTGRVARMAARMPAVGAPLASVATMGGVAGGALSAAPGAIATAGRGAMALGGRAIPLIGAAMTAYDAYTGFTDEEGQRRVFGLDQAKDPTVSQKVAMGASKVLDLGGLTSGVSGLLADGAGALGMKNLQESLTFNSDDMAKGLHAVFSNEKALATMGVKEGDSGTLGQNLAVNVARAVNMGGVVSGTASLLGGIAEDLGFDGAKEALTFDTGELAESLYDFFGPMMGADKKREGNRVIINSRSERYNAPGARQGITEADVKKAGKQYDFSALEQANGLPAGYMNAMAMIESGGNPLAYNAGSQAAGLYQFVPKTAQAYGVTDPYDVQQASAGAAALAVDNAREFQKKMGRAPEARELYLMHQQGSGGAPALLQNPNMSAVEALSLGGQKNASAAITGNGGNLNMTAREFAELQMAKYDKQFMALQIASERGGVKQIPLDQANKAAVDAAKQAPNMVLKNAANTAPTATAESFPTPQGFSGVLDIQREQAKADLVNPATGELTAKMDPRMTEVMAKLDKTLSGMKPTTAESKGASTATSNTTNNYYGQSRGVADHDYVRWPNSDKG